MIFSSNTETSKTIYKEAVQKQKLTYCKKLKLSTGGNRHELRFDYKRRERTFPLRFFYLIKQFLSRFP